MSGISERNPFVGPRPIQQGETLHGRKKEVDELYDRLQARRIVVLHSPSGAGKSSLIHAGLIPRLQTSGFDVWKPIRVNLDPCGLDVPEGTNRFVLSATVSLEEELPAERRRSPAELAKLDLLKYLDGRPRRKGRQDRSVVLLFDQFEEVLTADPLAEQAKHDFFDAVGRALLSASYWALFVIREDYLAAFAPYRDRIPTQMGNTFRIDLLGLEGAREVAVNLAEQGGRTFPAVDKLVHDLSMVQVQQADGSFVPRQGVHVEPVQLQVVCRRLWESMPEDDLTIDAEDIEAHGSVTQALGDYYATTVAAIAKGDVALERKVREWVGERLIVGGIRSQVRQGAGSSAGLDNDLIDGLLDRYVVRTEQRAGANWYELSHDRLVEPVQQSNKAWEQQHLHHMQVQAKLWEDAKRPPALLLGDDALAEALAWAQQNPSQLTEAERDYLEQSRVLRADQALRRRTHKVITAVIGAIAVVAIALGVLAWFARIEAEDNARVAEVQKHEAEVQKREAEVQKREAEDQKHEAERQQVIAEAKTKESHDSASMYYAQVFMDQDPTKAMLGLANVDEHRVLPPAGWVQSAALVLQRPHLRAKLQSGGKVRSVSFSHDGEHVLTTSDDGTVRVWSADGRGKPVLEQREASSASFDPERTHVAIASRDGTVRVWNADGSGEPVVLPSHGGEVSSLSFAPDGQRIVTVSSDGVVRIRSVDGSAEPVVVSFKASDAEAPDAEARGDEEHRILSASFSPDGQRVLAISSDGVARIRDADGSGEPIAFSTEEHRIGWADFSRDSQSLMTISRDKKLRVWQANGLDRRTAKDRGREIESASFSPTGSRIVSVSADHTAQVRNWQGVLMHNIRAQEIESASYALDGRRIVTASKDMVRVWSADGSGRPQKLESDLCQGATSASFSPDGRRIAVASEDGACVWDLEPPLRFHDDVINSVGFSPDGKRIVTASNDQEATVRVWSRHDSGEPSLLDPLLLEQNRHGVLSASFSPDGAHVVTTSYDKLARVWALDDSAAPLVPRTLKGHKGRIRAASFSPDGKRIVTASDDKTARVWELDGSVKPVVLKGHGGWVKSASFSPDGTRIITASDDKTARVWDVGAGTLSFELQGHEDKVTWASFNPDGTRIITASNDGTARVWNAGDEGHPLLFILQGHADRVIWAGFGRHERAKAGEGGSKGQTETAQSIVTASADGTVRVWDEHGALLLVVGGDGDTITAAGISPDGHSIITAYGDGTAREWTLDSGELRRRLSAATTLCMPAEDLVTYIGQGRDDARGAFEACECSYGRLLDADRCPGGERR